MFFHSSLEEHATQYNPHHSLVSPTWNSLSIWRPRGLFGQDEGDVDDDDLFFEVMTEHLGRRRLNHWKVGLV